MGKAPRRQGRPLARLYAGDGLPMRPQARCSPCARRRPIPMPRRSRGSTRPMPRSQLSWVKTPYWRKVGNGESWFGRGLVQLTHQASYVKLATAIGHPKLATHPNEALDMGVSIKVMFVGMEKGLFTGKKLADYFDGRKRSVVYGVLLRIPLINELTPSPKGVTHPIPVMTTLRLFNDKPSFPLLLILQYT